MRPTSSRSTCSIDRNHRRRAPRRHPAQPRRQTGLNLSSELHRAGVLEQYGVKVIGVNVDAIQRGEDRTAFKETMTRLGIDMPRSQAVNGVEEAERVAAELGYPVVIRPAYTMGGTGGGLVYNAEELRVIAGRGLAASLIHQVLVEESVLGWEELELEVVRDSKNQMITVCFIENVDAMGSILATATAPPPC